jgi:NAD(P)-dependent dehydrogenase (short-subunit alcohol dehydrogenase family)
MDNVMEHGPLDAYQVSKAALISLSRGIALTYGRKGIRSNTVCPGAVWTPMTAAIYEDPARVEAMKQRTPLPQIGTAQNIADACLFLLSDRASFITGTDLMVDGGLMTKLV